MAKTTKSSAKSSTESPRIQQAINIATKAHEGQLRKTGEPYIIHPLAVMKILEEWNMDEDTIIAGILHDTVEDTNLTLSARMLLFSSTASLSSAKPAPA